MKIKQSFGLIVLGIAFATTSSWAQTTPTGTVNSTTYPQGAIAPDSGATKASRNQKRTMKRNRKMTDKNAGNGTNTSTQEAQYRKSSSSEGTSINNSNSTNYNSNNVTNAPTGAGSNPNASPSTGTTTTAKPNEDGPNEGTNNTAANPSRNADAGLATAVSGAKTSETPAVKAGSTVRNTSIGDFVASSPNYTTLQNALQSANLWETLKGTGPYTLFAPTNNAFKKLSASAQSGLLEGRNREALKQLLTNHVVSGSLSEAELTQKIKAGNGKASLQTLGGGTLTAQLESNGRIALTDEQGGKVMVDVTENPQMNGMVYGISSVLMSSTAAAAFR